ncbi:MAG: hypothetical protein WCK01_00460 [Candidatus Uhrbacteria bacterium]
MRQVIAATRDATRDDSIGVVGAQNETGQVIGAQAIDFRVPGVSSTEVALWIRATLPFDRMYVYGAERPLHVSHGPDGSAVTCAMVCRGGRLVPLRAGMLDAQELRGLLGGE